MGRRRTLFGRLGQTGYPLAVAEVAQGFAIKTFFLEGNQHLDQRRNDFLQRNPVSIEKSQAITQLPTAKIYGVLSHRTAHQPHVAIIRPGTPRSGNRSF